MLAVLGMPSPLRSFESGQPGWLLERFGRDVAVLRTRRAESGATHHAADIVLSCEGGERRLRLVLPEDATPLLGGRRTGTVLVRTVTGGAGIVTGYALANARTLLVSGDAVAAIGRAVEARAGDLALLLHPDGRPFVPARLVALHLSLPFGPGDAAAFRDFAAQCGDAPER